MFWQMLQFKPELWLFSVNGCKNFRVIAQIVLILKVLRLMAGTLSICFICQNSIPSLKNRITGDISCCVKFLLRDAEARSCTEQHPLAKDHPMQRIVSLWPLFCSFCVNCFLYQCWCTQPPHKEKSPRLEDLCESWIRSYGNSGTVWVMLPLSQAKAHKQNTLAYSMDSAKFCSIWNYFFACINTSWCH